MLTTHRGVAQNYFADGSIELACPPLKALLHIMRDGHFEGQSIEDPAIRDLFDPKQIVGSDWYRDRLLSRQHQDVAHWQRLADYLQAYDQPFAGLDVLKGFVAERLTKASDPNYPAALEGTLGRDSGFRP
jgi:hypothetical protein